MKKVNHYNMLILCLGLFFSQAAAQTSFNSHLFRFSDSLEYPSMEGTLSPDEAWVNEKYKWLFRASYDVVDDPVIGLDPSRNNQIATVVESLHTFFLGTGYRLNNRISFGLDLPLHRIHMSQNFAAGNDTTAWTIGDIHARMKWRVTPDNAFVHAALMPYVSFPTGSADYLVTDDSYAFGAKLLLDKKVGRFNVATHAGYTWANNAGFQTIDRSGRIELGAGALFRITSMFGVNAETLLGLTLPGYDKDQNPIEMRLGMRAVLGRVHAFLGTGLEALRGERSSNYTIYAGVKVPFLQEKETPIVTATPAPTPTPEIREVVVKEQVDLLQKTLNLYRQVLFEFDKAIIKPASFAMLDSAAEIIKKYESQINRIVIEGHTDSVGTNEYNMRLSHARAKSVHDYLIGKGVSPAKLAHTGFGEEKPVAKEVDAASQQLNRRVEFVVEQIVYDPQEIKEKANVVKEKPADEKAE